jgi:uncharacterized protein YlxW (UPF0749 family)
VTAPLAEAALAELEALVAAVCNEVAIDDARLFAVLIQVPALLAEVRAAKERMREAVYRHAEPIVAERDALLARVRELEAERDRLRNQIDSCTATRERARAEAAEARVAELEQALAECIVGKGE